MTDTSFNPQLAIANARHEFGEHGGVNMSIEEHTANPQNYFHLIR